MLPLYPWEYLAILVIVVVYRFYNWIESLIAFLPPLAACIEFSNSKKDRTQGKGFQVSSSSIPPYPVFKVHNVFSDEVYSPSSWKKSRKIEIAYVVLGIS